jgi:ABC-2 type transport system ATP-binding protein
LKILAGIYPPNKGGITVTGKLTPFIELGVGFNPELTGRENVYLNGALLGFTRQEMEVMYEDIVKFAEIKRFMDQKLKNYSSGMQVRLAFSIAIRAESDILLLDEVLAVGDEAFQRKCYDYFETLRRNRKTVILVTHDMSAVRRFCDKALLIENGLIKKIGSPDEVASQYTLDNFGPPADTEPVVEAAKVDEEAPKKLSELSEGVTSLVVTTDMEQLRKQSDSFRFRVEYQTNNNTPVYIGISVTYKGISIIEANTVEWHITDAPNELQKVEYELSLERFNPAEYNVTAAIFEVKTKKLLGYTTDAYSTRFIIADNNTVHGGLLVDGGNWVQ